MSLSKGWARWAGFNDDVGPWSLPASMAIATKRAGEVKQANKAPPEMAEAEDAAGQPMKLAA